MVSHSPRFLMVSLRTGDIGQQVAHTEYEDVMRATGLTPEELDLRILDAPDSTIGDVSSYAGVYVGGSSQNMSSADYSDYDRNLHRELAHLVESPTPSFLICFGVSWLNHHTGGHIDHTYAEDSGPSQVEILAEDPITHDLPRTFTALTGHTEATHTRGSGLTLLATGPTCPTQLVKYGENTWGSQFHAEMDPEALKKRMEYYLDYGYFPREEFDSIVEIARHTDTTAANQILRNFKEYCLAQIR